MNKKRILVYVTVLAVLAVLVYFQFRNWKNFDWAMFWSERPDPVRILYAAGFIYFSYFLRALRWKIFLRPVRKEASLKGILPATVIGFTGLALLGRPGELIRPYLIARREGLTFSSQMAVWAVERIFDVAAFTVLLVLAIFLPGTALHSLPQYGEVKIFGFLFLALTVGLALGAILVERSGEALSQWVEKRFSSRASSVGSAIAQKVREFHIGLDTIHGPLAFLQLCALSLFMWSCVSMAYLQVVRAYGAALESLSLSDIFPLMASSMVGSLIQLPGVGGGSQLATISVLQRIYDIPHELAASCGILLWLATFVSVIPLGLVLAHFERLSLRTLSKESGKQEKDLAVVPPAV